MEDMSALYNKDAHASKYYNAKDRDKKDDHQCIFYWGTHPTVMHERILRLGDVLELPRREEVFIVANPNDFSEKLLSKINVEKVHWVSSASEVAANKKKLCVKLEFSFFDKVFKRTEVPLKMRSKSARPWSKELLLVLKLSEKGFGFK